MPKKLYQEIPELSPNGELPEGWEYEDSDYSTITASKVAEATN